MRLRCIHSSCVISNPSLRNTLSSLHPYPSPISFLEGPTREVTVLQKKGQCLPATFQCKGSKIPDAGESLKSERGLGTIYTPTIPSHFRSGSRNHQQAGGSTVADAIFRLTTYQHLNKAIIRIMGSRQHDQITTSFNLAAGIRLDRIHQRQTWE